MSNNDFRQIANQSAPDRAERLFRASISAYCCLTYPTRIETQQLDQLAIPLYGSVSDEGLRYAAAALSECEVPPPQLVRRLAGERVEISAPLVIRTTALTDADLIMLIARQGTAHARVISRRKNLNPAIAALVRQIEMHAASGKAAASSVKADEHRQEPGSQTLDRLRGMMTPSTVTKSGVVPMPSYPRLRAAALSGDRDLLEAAMSQSLGIDLETASALLLPSSMSLLISALRALALTGEQALLIAACAIPGYFVRPNAAIELVNAFAGESIGAARERIRTFGDEEKQASGFARALSRAALARSA